MVAHGNYFSIPSQHNGVSATIGMREGEVACVVNGEELIVQFDHMQGAPEEEVQRIIDDAIFERCKERWGVGKLKQVGKGKYEWECK